ncbi:UDP-N-acetylmuramoylalanyl-D-glutamate--2,6-diaminopimelate ligase [Staphylococcus aureus]|nr:UDP-N-acetylmuramoylalanyl-D-glutamate--2,6-diaminopimelate ligase [Staphylococcus aureus]
MDASMLFEKVKVKRVLGSLEQQIDDITTDSRTARKGSIFVASVGYTVDSHKFCENVVEQGCTLVVVNKEQSLPANVTQVVVPDTLRVASIPSTHII